MHTNFHQNTNPKLANISLQMMKIGEHDHNYLRTLEYVTYFYKCKDLENYCLLESTLTHMQV